jgi:TonB family protein
MAVSFAMVAAVVLIMVKSVSDLDSINPVRMTSAPVTEEKRYGRINIELVPPEKIEEKAELKPQAMAESSEKLTPPIVAGETTTPAEAVMEAPVQLPPVQTAKFAARPGVMKDAGAPEQEETFSILPAPVTSPDSVNIDAIFVSNESIALNQQSYSASLSELYSDTMVAQSLHLQASRVVTIEKMPRPLRMEIPEYPVWAKKRGLSGTVWIKAKVNSDGKVTDAMVISCDMKAAGFEEAALEAAKHNLFVPASTNGMNLSVWVVYPVKFINKD